MILCLHSTVLTLSRYNNLGINWASSIPAFLALICVPLPFLFYKFGPRIRKNCKYAGEAEAFMKRMQSEMEQHDEGAESDATAVPSEREEEKEREREEEEQEAFDYSYEGEDYQPRFEQIKTTASKPVGPRRGTSYEGNPYDIDRVNTRESFKSSRRQSRANSRAVSRVNSRASSRR